MLTKDLGIINAIAHGAWKTKSKLRAFTQLFNYLKVYLYFNPVKQSYKINDAESLMLYNTVEPSLRKYYIVSVCAEIILKSFGGGESVGEMFYLFLGILSLLDKINEQDADVLLIQFLWRFLITTGHRPDTDNCNKCGIDLIKSGDMYYSEGMTGFVCSHCRNIHGILLNPGMKRYLEMTEKVALVKAMSYKVEKKSEKSLILALSGIVETCIESPLLSIRSGEKVLYG